MKKKISNCIILKFEKEKKASARNVLLKCIFLYIHICFYTARIFHPCRRFQNRGKFSHFPLFLLLPYSKHSTLSLVCQESCCRDASRLWWIFVSILWRKGFFWANLLKWAVQQNKPSPSFSGPRMLSEN